MSLPQASVRRRENIQSRLRIRSFPTAKKGTLMARNLARDR